MSGRCAISRRVRFVVSVVAMLGVGGGCTGKQAGPQRFHLSGKVTFNGQPIPAGVIIFSPDSAGGNTGPQGTAPIKDGQYTTRHADGKGVVGGAHIVRVVGLDGKMFRDPTGEIYRSGAPLFPPWETQMDLGKEEVVRDIEVPAEASQPAVQSRRKPQ